MAALLVRSTADHWASVQFACPTHHLGKRADLLIRRNKRRLDEELVLALGVGRGVGREGLENDWVV
jgi:hypothetical protein